MLDIGLLELLIVAVLGLLVLGPDKLPSTIRTLMAWWRQLKNSIESAKQQVQDEIGYAEMNRQLENYQESARKIGEEISSVHDIDKFNQQQGRKHAAKNVDKATAGAKPDRKGNKNNNTASPSGNQTTRARRGNTNTNKNGKTSRKQPATKKAAPARARSKATRATKE